MKLSSRIQHCFIFIFLIFLHLQYISAYHWNGNTLYDLESLTSAGIQSEASSWTCSRALNTANVLTYLCGSDYILGGYNIVSGSGSSYSGHYFERIYSSGIPVHNQVKISIKIFAIDSWDGGNNGDRFTISLDGTSIGGWTVYGNTGSYATKLCGNTGYKDYPPFMTYITFPHTSTTSLTLRLTAILDEDASNESLGFRDIVITFETANTPNQAICGVSPGPLADKPCPCSTSHQYPNPAGSGNCSECHSTCATCNGGLINNCQSCPAGSFLSSSKCITCTLPCGNCTGTGTNKCTTCIDHYHLVGTTCSPTCESPLSPAANDGSLTTCTSPCSGGSFVLWNGTCSASCNPPLDPEIIDTFPVCFYPCEASQWLYWNGTCGSSCDFPFSQRVEGSPTSRKFCDYPCQTSEYLYWNGSCKASCSSPPLSVRTEGSPSRNFCDYSCANSDFLYWNGTCRGSCDSPFSQRIEGSLVSKRFCDYPCQISDYLYWNGSCKTSCLTPLTVRTEGLPNRNFCDYSCVSSEFLYWNGTCGVSCDSPFSQRMEGSPVSKRFCDYPCQLSEYLYWNGSCKSSCPSPLSVKVQGARNYCNYPCSGSDYLYWNGTCKSSCNFPLSQHVEGSLNFCDYPCQTSEYLYWNGSCKSSCPFPLSTRSQGSPSRNYCGYQCSDSQYLYWNGSCKSSCDLPLIQRAEGNPISKKFCDYPCQVSEYLYWNTSCEDSCPSPLSSRIEGSPMRNYCDYLCSSSEYLYWNGTCTSQCKLPFSPRTASDGSKFCDFACLVNQYLLTNGSCVDVCPQGFFGNYNNGFCQACQDPLCGTCQAYMGTRCDVCLDENILDSIGICQRCDFLESEYVKYIDTNQYQYKLKLWPETCDLDETILKQYLLPTQETKNLFPLFSFSVYLNEDDTEKSFILQIKFEDPVLVDNKLDFTLKYLNTNLEVPKTPEKVTPISSTLKGALAAVSGATLGAGLSVGAAASVWSLINFQQFVGYLAYLNIQYPAHLETFLTMFSDASLEFLPNPLESLMEKASESWGSVVDEDQHKEKYQLPNKFTKFETPTLFISNAGSTFSICLALVIFPYLLDCLRKIKKIQNNKFFIKVHSGLRWNVPMRTFLESGVPLLFAILIQMRKISYGNIPYGLSTVSAYIAFIYFYFMFKEICKSLRKLEVEKAKEPNIENSIGTLYEGLVIKKDKPSAKYYYLLILLRGMLLVFLDVFMDCWPIIQISCMIIFNFFFICYVWKVVEFESRYLTWTSKVKEALIFMGEILISLLYHEDENNKEFKDLIGWIIVGLFVLMLVLEISYGVYLQVVAFRIFFGKVMESMKKRKKKRKVQQDSEMSSMKSENSSRKSESSPGKSENSSGKILTIEI